MLASMALPARAIRETTRATETAMHDTARPRMHYARLANSPRQQRVLKLLSDGQEHTTRDIVLRANVCAVNSIISELRCNGINVACRQERRIYNYRLGH